MWSSLVYWYLKKNVYILSCHSLNSLRVRTGPGKPGKSWNFIMAFSRTGKSWKKATGPGKFWKSVNSAKNMKCMGSSKEN